MSNFFLKDANHRICRVVVLVLILSKTTSFVFQQSLHQQSLICLGKSYNPKLLAIVVKKLVVSAVLLKKDVDLEADGDRVD